MKINTYSVVEMALVPPTEASGEFFEKWIRPKDYLPTIQDMEDASDSGDSASLDWKSRTAIDPYVINTKVYKLFERIIVPLRKFWDNKDAGEEALAKVILANPVRGDRHPKPGKDPFDSNVPEDIRVAESLQALRQWVDYYNFPLWADWRPELKRMVNELALIVKKRAVRPYRATTARSVLQTQNPIRTMKSGISEEVILDEQTGEVLQEVWKVKVTINVDGGRQNKAFVDYYDTQIEAANSDLFRDAQILSVPDYMEKYSDNELI